MFNLSSNNDVNIVGDVSYRLVTGKSNMKIHLDHHFTNRIYTSSSSVSGHVQIEVSKDTQFDKVQILFMGTGKSRMDGVRSPHITSHTFLKLEMPIPESSYPAPRIYEAGQSYRIPFNFVIPRHLTLNACNHNIDSDAVKDSHLCLPPSMGSWGGKDDLAPDMSTVEYTVVARLFAEEDHTRKLTKIMEMSYPVRILPAHPESPPLHVTPRDKLYKMSKTKTLRKSIIAGKVGKLTATVKQPSAVMLSSDATSATTTAAQVDLVFDPSSSLSLPPTVTGVSSKLSAVTYYCAGAINGFPNMGEWVRAFGADSRGSYPSSVSLAATHIDKLRWRQNIKMEARRGSAASTTTTATSDSIESVSDAGRTGQDSDPDRRRGSKDSSKEESPIYHTASFRVPIDLPVHKKLFIPSFHSCIVSRVYVLWLTVSLSCGGNNTNIMLGVPLQIGVLSAEGVIDHLGPPSFEAAVEEAQADEFLRPRTMSVPDVQFQRHALPGYADLMSGRAVVAH
ncbi:arrestin [Truncatella angustata]|uniref:Arrestin n=1 Tax=Truncatella angustata TaxID=152316 RepID=A0A9P9A0Z5_9PEZI|nr:arrestin [Truncatella angustata]KAH6658981.1 arrestin [Truncatella angustata]KAH8203213.1 hypothetical protein TruAng_002618 [Truncatella angustata]